MSRIWSCRSPVVQADGVSAGGPEERGHVGSGAAALWRPAEGGLPGVPVHRSGPAGHGHAGVLQSQDAVGRRAVVTAGTRSTGQSAALRDQQDQTVEEGRVEK